MPTVPSELLVDIVYNNLRQDILAKKYIGGKKLAVRELCEHYGVSETPVKQALNRLVTDNLVENIPRRGMRVAVFDQKAFEETLEARCMVEQYAVDAAIEAARADKKFVRDLKKALAACTASIDKYFQTLDEDDYNLVLDADLRFHKVLIGATRNQFIVDVYEDLCVRQKMFFLCHANIRKRLPLIKEEHAGICAAILKEDRLEAVYLIKRYVASVKSYL